MTINNTAVRFNDCWQHPDMNVKQQVERCFGKATTTYAVNARLQRLCADWLMTQLSALLPEQKPQVGVDLGCGPGINVPLLAPKCQQLVACDLSSEMLSQAKNVAKCHHINHLKTYCADAEMLPMPSCSADWVYSNLMIQWCDPITNAIREIYRILKPGGVAVVSTLMQGSLSELAQAWETVDDFQHVNDFVSTSQLHQQIALANIESPTILRKQVTLEYHSVLELSRELKGLGANTVTSGKASGLTGKGRWQQMTANYEQFRNSKQALPASYQLACLIIQKSA